MANKEKRVFLSPPNPEDTRIGILAAYEIKRLVEEDPLLACKIISKAEKAFQQTSFNVEDYCRNADNTIGPATFGEATSYIHTNHNGTLILQISPPGPICFSDENIWVDTKAVPESTLAAIEANSIGKALSTYASITGFDLDSLAPTGIEKAERLDMFADEFLVLSYPIQSIPFPAFAHEIRMRAKDVICHEVHNSAT